MTLDILKLNFEIEFRWNAGSKVLYLERLNPVNTYWREMHPATLYSWYHRLAETPEAEYPLKLLA
jgi:hypothetical protein